MNTKLLVLAISSALLAAAQSFAETAEQLSDGDVIQSFPNSAAQAADTIAAISHTAVANAELDASGLPWDARIHASTKTKTQKNIWTARKGLADGVADAVTAELRQKYPAPQATTPVTSVPAIPATPVIGVPQLSVAKTPYTELVDWLAKNTGADKVLSDAWIGSMFAQNNTTLAALAENHDLAGEILKALRGVLTQAGVAEVA
jgi:hypothetical protein